MPPGPNAGSLDERPRADLAKSMQNCLPSLVLAFASNAVMPAEDPSGRAIAEQPDLVVIESPTAPVTGLVASQLYCWVAVADLSVAL